MSFNKYIGKVFISPLSNFPKDRYTIMRMEEKENKVIQIEYKSCGNGCVVLNFFNNIDELLRCIKFISPLLEISDKIDKIKKSI